MDIVDRGSDGIKFSANTSNSDNLVRWWLRTIKEAYPDIRPHDEGKYGHNITMPIAQVYSISHHRINGHGKVR